MVSNVEDSATAAAHTHIVEPTREAMMNSQHPQAEAVANSLAVQATNTRPRWDVRRTPNFSVGITDPSLVEPAEDMEYGTDSMSPGDHFRSTLNSNRQAAQEAFYDGLQS
jgi:hypothetical protein